MKNCRSWKRARRKRKGFFFLLSPGLLYLGLFVYALRCRCCCFKRKTVLSFGWHVYSHKIHNFICSSGSSTHEGYWRHCISVNQRERERETGARQANMSLIIAFSPSKSKYTAREKYSGVSMFESLRHNFTVYNVIECVFAVFLAFA